MDRLQRLGRILEELQKNNSLQVEDVETLLSISPATVRRDFNYLAQNYQVEKIWGGIALSPNQKIADTMLPLDERKLKYNKEKVAIAKRAAELVNDGEIIFIDGGTTTLEMVPFLKNKKVRIITNSILIAQRIETLDSNPHTEVFVTGGMLYPSSGLLVGPQAVDFIKNFNANWTFLSIGGISEAGPTNSNMLVVETEKAMLNHSERTVILADHSKIGKKDLIKICELEEIDFLITEDGKDIDLKSLEESGMKILKA